MGMIEIGDKDDVVVVSFTTAKILDQLAIDQVREEFKDLTLQAASGRKLLLDFSRVQFMSSSMIGQIVRLYKQCKNDKVKLKLCNIALDIKEVFRITGLSKLLASTATRTTPWRRSVVRVEDGSAERGARGGCRPRLYASSGLFRRVVGAQIDVDREVRARCHLL